MISSPNLPLEPVRRRKVADIVYELLRTRIVSGQFSMGERIVEAKVAQDLQVSRSPVREAIRRLMQEGLVIERPHCGVYVRELSADDVKDLYAARLAVESAALQAAVERRASTDALHAAIARMEAAAGSNDILGVVTAELDFHASICASSGNRVLESIFASLSSQILMALGLEGSASGALTEIARGHLPIVEAIESRETELAARLLREHVFGTAYRTSGEE